MIGVDVHLVTDDVFVCTHAAGQSVSVGHLVLALNTPCEPSGMCSTC